MTTTTGQGKGELPPGPQDSKNATPPGRKKLLEKKLPVLAHLHSVNEAKCRKENLWSLTLPLHPNSLRLFRKAALTRSRLRPIGTNTARARPHVPASPSVPCGDLCQLVSCPCASQSTVKTQKSTRQWSLFTSLLTIGSRNRSEAAVSGVDSCKAAYQHHCRLKLGSYSRTIRVQ